LSACVQYGLLSVGGRPVNSPAVTAVNQGNNNYVVAGKVDSFGDTLSDPRRFDSTGMFHWCAPQQLSSVIIVSCSSFQLLVITDIGADFSFHFLGAKDELPLSSPLPLLSSPLPFLSRPFPGAYDY